MRRLAGLLALGVRRTVSRLGGGSRQVLLSVVGVALAVALMTTVSGVALELAAGSTVAGDDVDYWVVPESGDATSVAVPVGGSRLGSVHETTARLSRDDRVTYATPVLVSVIRLRSQPAGTSEYVLAVGVVPPDGERSVVGLPTDSLAPGDPHYAGGDYDGPFTGEAVVSDAAAELLSTETGDRLAVPRSNRSLSVTAVAEGDVETGAGPLPVVLVHLSELQSLTGATDGDPADQLLVATDDPSVRGRLAGLYPHTTVVSRTGFTGPDVSTTSLPLAIGVAALVAGVAVGVLFVATMMGLAVTAERRTLAALAAVGFSTRSRSVLVLTETLTVAGLGGLLGSGVGAVAVALTNATAGRYFGVGDVARFDPLLVAYGVVAALCIGLVAAVYPVWLSRRTDPLEVLGR